MKTFKRVSEVPALRSRFDIGDKDDGWENTMTGLGKMQRDKKMHTTYTPSARLNHMQLAFLYSGEGLARRIVDRPAEDMTREWFTIANDKDNLIKDEMKRLKVKAMVNKALRWQRLFGGGLMVFGIRDGGKLDQELTDNIDYIEIIKVYHRYQVRVFTRYEDESHPKYGEPEVYIINPINGSPIYVHESRTIRFDGLDVPDEIRTLNDGWGDSVITGIYQHLVNMCESFLDVRDSISEYVLNVLKIRNLQNYLATNKENLVIQRVDIMDQTKKIANTVLIDENEDFIRMPSGAGDITGPVDKLIQVVSAISEIPVTILMGESPAGLNATGMSDIIIYYDGRSADQEAQLTEPCEQILKLIMRARSGPFRGKEVKGWDIKWNPLYKPTLQETLDMKVKQQQIDSGYIGDGVLDPREIRKNRFENEYSFETTIDNSMKLPLLPEPVPSPEPEPKKVFKRAQV